MATEFPPVRSSVRKSSGIAAYHQLVNRLISLHCTGISRKMRNMDFNSKVNIRSLLHAFEAGQITLDEAASQIHCWISGDPQLLQLIPHTSSIFAKLAYYREEANRLGIDLIRVYQLGCVVRKNENVELLLGIDSFGEVTLSVSTASNNNEVYHTSGRVTDWINVRLLAMIAVTRWPGEYIDPQQVGDKFEVCIFARAEAEEQCVSRWVYGTVLPPSEINELIKYIRGMAVPIATSFHS